MIKEQMYISMTFIRLLTKILLLLFIATCIADEEVSDDELNQGTLIISGTREYSFLIELAGNVTVLSFEDLGLVNHQHIQEILARVPGANFARGNGQEYLPALRSPVLTGADACGSILTAVDGIPLRAAGFCNANELFEANTEQARRIEVIRGPGNVLYGSNAMNGIVNVITPEVALEPETVLGFEVGPHGIARFKFSDNVRWAEHGLRLDLLLSHDNGYRMDSGFEQEKVSLRHEYRNEKLSFTTSLALANLDQDTAGYILGHDAYRDDDLVRTNSNPEAYRRAKSIRMATRINYDMDKKQHWLITPYFRYTHMAFLMHFLPGEPLEENGQKSIGLQSTYYNDINKRLKLLTGIDMEYTDGFLRQIQEEPTQGSDFLRETIPMGKQYDYQIDALMFAPYMQLKWVFDDDLSFLFGLRYEQMNYDYDNLMLAGRTADDGMPCGFGGCRYSRPADRKDSFENWSPKFMVLYNIDNYHQAYINLSHGFRAPQSSELYRLQRSQQVADLDSEELQSIELGTRGNWHSFTYVVTVFSMEKRNVIFRDSNLFNVDEGITKHKGIELELNMAIKEDWMLALATTYANHVYKDSRTIEGESIGGNQLDSAPHLLSNFRLAWNFTAKSRLELEWLHQSDYFTDPENLHSYPGHDIFNFRVHWNLYEQLNVLARITNLTDRNYAERADYTKFSGDRYFPGEPRSLYIGLERSY